MSTTDCDADGSSDVPEKIDDWLGTGTSHHIDAAALKLLCCGVVRLPLYSSVMHNVIQGGASMLSRRQVLSYVSAATSWSAFPAVST